MAGAAKKLDALADSTADKSSFAAAESRQTLKDLKAELEAAKDLLNFPDPGQGNDQLAQQWFDRLASLPQLNRQLGREPQKGQGFGQSQLKEFSMNRPRNGELVGVTVDAQQFLHHDDEGERIKGNKTCGRRTQERSG